MLSGNHMVPFCTLHIRVLIEWATMVKRSRPLPSPHVLDLRCQYYTQT